MENYVYAIPSYNRAGKQTTVEYLSRAGVPKKKIYVFVQTEKDLKDYQIITDKANVIYMSARRGVEARNNILNRMSGHNIVMMDDDVKQLYSLRNGKLHKILRRDEMTQDFNNCFAQIDILGASIFGIYPIANAFFMSNDISTKVAVNTVFGFAKGFSFKFDETFDTKEDAELCGRLLWHGLKVARFNGISVSADHRKDKNGYFDEWHQEENIRSVKQLCLKYPDIFAVQKGKPWEVRIKMKDERFPDGEY